MNTKIVFNRIFKLLFLGVLFFSINLCTTKTEKKMLTFKDYPNLKIGFSTQNFQNAFDVSVESLTEIIEYASEEGYQFIQLRDNLANLSADACRALDDVARKNNIEIIYEIHKNPLDTGFIDVFQRALANTLLFPGPGILRTAISNSEFNTDLNKKGWTEDELTRLISISENCAQIAKEKNVYFIVENFNEPFSGDDSTYFGLNDFFAGTSHTGLQFDVSNPFSKTNRVKADPEKIMAYLSTLGDRWVTTHLKTVHVYEGIMQPVLTENPLPIETVVDLMGQMNVIYAALELAAVENKQQCFENHAASIRFLKDSGVLNK